MKMFNTLVLLSLTAVTAQAYGTSASVCSTGIYKSLAPLLGSDLTVHKFCNSLPSTSNKYNRASCNNRALRALSFEAVKAFCTCIKQVCPLSTCSGSKPDSCRRSPCGNSCTNNKTDRNNCGVCNTKCTAPATCIGGVCTTPGPTCSAPNKLCSGICKAINTDSNNCGDCGVSCPADARCVDGECKCNDSTKGLCSGQCVELNTNQNCGVCGFTCGEYATCLAFAGCACIGPFRISRPSDRSCVAEDDNNCGGFGRKCTGGKVCSLTTSNGCVCPPSTPIETPSGQCVASDNANCGEFGRACDASYQNCVDGQCHAFCQNMQGGTCTLGGVTCCAGACLVSSGSLGVGTCLEGS